MVSDFGIIIINWFSISQYGDYNVKSHKCACVFFFKLLQMSPSAYSKNKCQCVGVL